MLSIKEAIIVEGKYDKQRIQAVCDALIITTEGFRIFRDRDKKEFLKALAERQGLLILTDSDRAGFAIRSHLKSFIPSQYIKNAYIPSVHGKERRKPHPSKEGLLGVEGFDEETLKSVIIAASTPSPTRETPLTKADLYFLGLSGKDESAILRRALCAALSLPLRLSANALLEILNATFTKEELTEYLKTL